MSLDIVRRAADIKILAAELFIVVYVEREVGKGDVR